MYGIFGKPLKRDFQTCMGHGGVSVQQQKFFQPATCTSHGLIRCVKRVCATEPGIKIQGAPDDSLPRPVFTEVV